MGRELSVDKRGTSDGVSNKRKKDKMLQSSSHTYLKGVWGAESHPIMALQRCLLLLPYKRRGGNELCFNTGQQLDTCRGGRKANREHHCDIRNTHGPHYFLIRQRG